MARRGRAMGTRRTNKVLAIIAAVAVLGAVVVAVGPTSAQGGQGIGVAPSTLRIEDPALVRGGSMERTLSFQQHDYDLARVEVRVLSPSDPNARDASSWITVDPSGVIDVPRTADHPVKVLIDVPSSASNGQYRAKVEFRVLQACESGGSCAAVQTAASALLQMTVGGEQVKRIKVLGSPQLNDAEEGGPLQFQVPLENIGNVVADPRIRLQVQDKHETSVLRTYWFNETIIKPGESGVYTQILRELDLPRDQYWAIVTVYLDGALVKTANPQMFVIVEAGELSRSAVLKTIQISGDLTTASVGDLVKLSAIVQNTGQAPVLAQFKGEVWVDGKLRDTIGSEVLEVAIGETAALDVIYTIQHSGQHEFKGRVKYGSQVTSERSLLLAVEGGAGAGGIFVWVGLGMLLVVAGSLASVILARSRQQAVRRRRRAAPPPGGRAPARGGDAARTKAARPGTAARPTRPPGPASSKAGRGGAGSPPRDRSGTPARRTPPPRAQRPPRS